MRDALNRPRLGFRCLISSPTNVTLTDSSMFSQTRYDLIPFFFCFRYERDYIRNYFFRYGLGNIK